MTPAAESLVQLGQRVFQDVREPSAPITDRTRDLRGTLRLAGGMTVCLYVFPPLLQAPAAGPPAARRPPDRRDGGAFGGGDPRRAASTRGC